MSSDVISDGERLRHHVRMTEQNLDKADLSIKAIDSYERTLKEGRLLEAELTAIVDAARSKYLGPFYVGTELLSKLFQRYSEVEAAWRRLAKSTIAHERWVAITALESEGIPSDFAEDLISHALDDRSSKVRYWAVERVYTRKLTTLLPLLKARIQTEADAKVQSHLRWVLEKLERGRNLSGNTSTPLGNENS